MKFIVIDSEKREVREEEVEKDTLAQMQRIVGGLIERAHTIDDDNEIFVDEEGLLKGKQDFFLIYGAHQPFAGNGVIVGIDKKGNTIGSNLNVDQVRRSVQFASGPFVRTMPRGSDE